MTELIKGAKILCTADETGSGVKYLPDGCSEGIIPLEGNHWRIRTVVLHAFSDDSDSYEFDIGENVEVVNTLISNTEISVKADADHIDVRFAEPRAYALIEVKMGVNNNV